jgi:hypothetical protein
VKIGKVGKARRKLWNSRLISKDLDLIEIHDLILKCFSEFDFLWIGRFEG